MSRAWHSICFWGAIQDDKEAWLSFFKQCEELCSELPFPVTHFGAASDSISGPNYLIFNTRGRNRLMKALVHGESFSFLSLVSVPEAFKTMAFDANFSCCIRRTDHPRHPSIPWSAQVDFQTRLLETEAIIPVFEQIGRSLFSSAHLEEFCIEELPTNYTWNVNPTAEASREKFASSVQGYTRLRAEFYNHQSE